MRPWPRAWPTPIRRPVEQPKRWVPQRELLLRRKRRYHEAVSSEISYLPSRWYSAGPQPAKSKVQMLGHALEGLLGKAI